MSKKKNLSDDDFLFADKLKENDPAEPAKPPPQEEVSEPQPVDKQPKKKAEGSVGDQVLVVDDSPASLTVVCGILNKLGFDAISFRGADAAFEFLKSADPDLIHKVKVVFSDFEMPRMNGIEFLKSIRSMESTKKMPFVMLTSRGDREILQKAVALKVSGYVLKPITTDKLLETVNNLFPGRVAIHPDHVNVKK